MEPASAYLHIPFCRTRCAYCDFNTYAGQEQWMPAYVEALCREIRMAAGAYVGMKGEKQPLHTVFFGGGTPSLLSLDQVGEILQTIKDCFELHRDAEITLEANPGTLSQEFLAVLRQTGVNRLSMGMQSARQEELRLIQRQHTFEDVIQCATWAREAGFDNISLDLLFGIPGQSMKDWDFSLEMALALNSEHLSLYSLTIEEGTPFFTWMKKGFFSPADEDLIADMMTHAEERLEKAGFDHYEISNWARKSPDFRYECRHNLQYWRNQPYYGFGAGAHGCADGQRYGNATGIMDYIQLIQNDAAGTTPGSPAAVEQVDIDEGTAMQETMMLGLRLTREGVSRERFRERFSLDIEDEFGTEIKKLIRQGLLTWTDGGDVLRLTERGRFVGNRVFMEFVGER
jgi:oxygen-independent coproporphyrinogen-3 oxidase